MDSAKWFIGMLVLWLGASLWVGIADMNYLGAFANQSPIVPLFHLFGVELLTDAGQQVTIGWSNITSVVGVFVSAGLWDYDVLVNGNSFAQLIRILLICVSGGILFTFALVLWEHVPFIGRGST